MSAWDSTPQRNLLQPDNLERVGAEFVNGGVVFGLHYYCAGGRSESAFAFADYESYRRELLASRPGDHFTVYSANRLAALALARIGDPGSNQPLVIDDRFAEVKNALEAGKEVVFLWRHTSRGTGRTECDAGILWDISAQDLDDSPDIRSWKCGELLFFLSEWLDEDEYGVPVDSVSPGGRMRAHALVDGKRPDESGLTPVSGPY